MPSKKKSIATQKKSSLESIMFVVFSVFLFALPTFFFVSTTEFVQYAKLVLVVVTALLLSLLWAVKLFLSQKTTVTKTGLEVYFIAILVALFLSTLFSLSVPTSIFGQVNSWHFTLVQFFSYFVLLYTLTSVTVSRGWIQRFITSYVTGVFVASVISLFSFFNLFDNYLIDAYSFFGKIFAVIAIDGFSPVGNGISHVVFVLSGIGFVSVLIHQLYSADAVTMKKTKVATLLIMGIAMILSVFLWLGGMTTLFDTTVSLPPQVSLRESWRVATSAIRDYPYLGVGPSLFNSAFNAYRTDALNSTQYWNVEYNSAGNEYLTWLTTTGIIGLSAFALFILRVVIWGQKVSKSKMSVLTSEPLVQIQFISNVSLAFLSILMFFSHFSIVLMSLFFIMLIFSILVEKILTANKGIYAVEIEYDFSGSQNGGMSVSSFALSASAVIIVGFSCMYVYKDIYSNVLFARSISKATSNGTVKEIYELQRDAVVKNPYRNTFRRVYAETNIGAAEAISAERGESISESELEDVLSLVRQAIREIRYITEELHPYSAKNWNTRGKIYQKLIGVANGADQWAYHAFRQAIVLDEKNPLLHIDLGNFYLALSSAQDQIEKGTEGTAPTADIEELPENKVVLLSNASAAFQAAAQLKPDLVAPHYNLGLIFEEVEDYERAKQAFSNALVLLDEGTEQYDAIKAKIDSIGSRTEETSSISEPTVTSSPIPIPTTESLPTITPTPTPTVLINPTATPGSVDTITASPIPTLNN